jgi:hypothetical protein
MFKQSTSQALPRHGIKPEPLEEGSFSTSGRVTACQEIAGYLFLVDDCDVSVG